MWYDDQIDLDYVRKPQNLKYKIQVSSYCKGKNLLLLHVCLILRFYMYDIQLYVPHMHIYIFINIILHYDTCMYAYYVYCIN